MKTHLGPQGTNEEFSPHSPDQPFDGPTTPEQPFDGPQGTNEEFDGPTTPDQPFDGPTTVYGDTIPQKNRRDR